MELIIKKWGKSLVLVLDKETLDIIKVRKGVNVEKGDVMNILNYDITKGQNIDMDQGSQNNQ